MDIIATAALIITMFSNKGITTIVHDFETLKECNKAISESKTFIPNGIITNAGISYICVPKL